MKKNDRVVDKVNEEYAHMQEWYHSHSDDAWERIRGKWKKILLIPFILLIVGVLLFACAYFLLGYHAPTLEPEDMLPPLEGETEWGVERAEGVYTFLILGVDAAQSNTDTIMVATYNVGEGRIGLMSIPRDTMVNVSWDIKKINSVYSVLGMDGLRKHIRKIVGFAPDYYVKVNLNAFVETVDAIGGVEFDVPRNMDYDDPVQNLHIHLKKGYQKLDGTQAMGMVRWRHNNQYTAGYSDIDRTQIQQSFLKTLFKQCVELKNWTKISDYIDIFYRDVETNLELGELLWLAKQAMGVAQEDFNTFTLPGNYNASAWSNTFRNYQSYVTVNESETLKLVNEYLNPYEEDITPAMLDIITTISTGKTTTKPADTTSEKRDEKRDEKPDEKPTGGVSEATAGNLESKQKGAD